MNAIVSELNVMAEVQKKLAGGAEVRARTQGSPLYLLCYKGESPEARRAIIVQGFAAGDPPAARQGR
jgi:hypothetical protein